MFTKYVPYEKSVTQHSTSSSTVHEHRAPTDASAQLLRELQAEARDSVIATLECRDNKFSCRAILSTDHIALKHVLRAQFTLNGEQYDAEISIDENIAHDNKALATIVRNLLAKEIATKLVVDGLGDSWIWRKRK